MKLRILERQLHTIKPLEVVSVTFTLDRPTKLVRIVTEAPGLKVMGVWLQERKQDDEPEIGLPGQKLRINFKSVSLATIPQSKIGVIAWETEDSDAASIPVIGGVSDE